MSLPDFALLLPRFESAFGFAAKQVRQTVDRYPGRFVECTREGRWQEIDTECASEYAACLPGMMWVLHQVTRDVYWRERGEAYCRLLDALWTDPSRCGTNFLLYFGGHRRWYEATVADGLPELVLRERMIQAARACAVRFQPGGGYLCGPHGPDSLCLTSLLDVPLMLFAASYTQDERLADLAARHCATVRKCLVRGDGSVASEAVMDPHTGECRGWVTHIGRRGDSCWSCGLAWAILGFATVGSMLEFEPWLETARRSAQYLTERLFGQTIPFWDFDVSEADAPVLRDSSAAAIAALGLLVLADAEHRVGSEQARQRQHLQETGLRILAGLCEPEYLASQDAAWEGVLKNAVGNLPAGWAVGESLIWGDAFFLEALQRAIGLLRKRS